MSDHFSEKAMGHRSFDSSLATPYLTGEVGFMLLLTWIGTRVTIYYRKNFDWMDCYAEHLVELLVVLVCAQNRFQENYVATVLKDGILFAFTLVVMTCHLKSSEEVAKAILVAASLRLVLSEAGSVPVLTWTATCGMATTQLLRWPPAMKDYLRTLRTVCGPIYTILTVGACLKQNVWNGAPSSGVVFKCSGRLRSPTILDLAAVLSLIGSFLFRPDNASTWLLLSRCWNGTIKRWGGAAWSPSQDFARTKRMHASSMVVSFLCMVTKFLGINYDYSTRSIGITLIVLSSLGLACGTTLWKSKQSSAKSPE